MHTFSKIRSFGLLGLGLTFGLLLSGCSQSDTPSPSAKHTTTSDTPLPAVPDFTSIPAGEARKKAFFDFMAPLVHRANAEVLTQRQRLQNLMQQATRQPNDQAWLKTLAARYGLKPFNPESTADRKALLQRIDKVPTALALAQSANESAWGTSRFAREGHNYFGQWCYTPGCGIVPSQRAQGDTQEVQTFKHPYDSVVSYIHNLNTHKTYAKLRDIRAQARADGQPLTGLEMANGLVNYSARKEEYVKALQSMIRYNKLTQFNENH